MIQIRPGEWRISPVQNTNFTVIPRVRLFFPRPLSFPYKEIIYKEYKFPGPPMSQLSFPGPDFEFPDPEKK